MVFDTCMWAGLREATFVSLPPLPTLQFHLVKLSRRAGEATWAEVGMTKDDMKLHRSLRWNCATAARRNQTEKRRRIKTTWARCGACSWNAFSFPNTGGRRKKKQKTADANLMLRSKQIGVDPFHFSARCLSSPTACSSSHAFTGDRAASSPGVTWHTLFWFGSMPAQVMLISSVSGFLLPSAVFRFSFWTDKVRRVS